MRVDTRVLKTLTQKTIGSRDSSGVIIERIDALVVRAGARTPSQLAPTDVGVEKLIPLELAENSSRQDALQAIFSDRVDIFYHQILVCLRRKRVFQQPQTNAPIDPKLGRDSRIDPMKPRSIDELDSSP
jgi:hypothetical protein